MRQSQIVGGQKIFTEFGAEFNSNLFKETFPFDKDLEMTIDNFPFLGFAFAHLFEVVKEVCLLLMSVHESELLVDYLLLTTATDEFALGEHCFIIISFYVILRFGVDIEAEKLPARQYIIEASA